MELFKSQFDYFGKNLEKTHCTFVWNYVTGFLFNTNQYADLLLLSFQSASIHFFQQNLCNLNPFKKKIMPTKDWSIFIDLLYVLLKKLILWYQIYFWLYGN